MTASRYEHDVRQLHDWYWERPSKDGMRKNARGTELDRVCEDGWELVCVQTRSDGTEWAYLRRAIAALNGEKQ